MNHLRIGHHFPRMQILVFNKMRVLPRDCQSKRHNKLCMEVIRGQQIRNL